MQTPAAPASGASELPLTRPAYDVGQEIRFAVVLYGGVSLAIYMNGIAQELLRLVRATAVLDRGDDTPPEARFADEELRDTERVYRRLGERLSRQGAREADGRRTIRTRFVVDTISGTSAGGINGIFLAKALANDQSIDTLEQLWIDEGDISTLINDSESVRDLGLQVGEQRSLLSGDRMYVKLLEALRNMDASNERGTPSVPLVKDVHLYVTTTDIRGLPVSLQLEDEPDALERRHKHVFHLIHGQDADGTSRTDFTDSRNRFLAYVARCTSSFPFAFEPMTLERAQELAPSVEGASADRGPSPLEYKSFFEDYARTLRPDASAQDVINTYLTRSFGDGGYLDNKPFGYAIDALSLRADSLPSERKLVYVEPTPERLHVEGPGRPVNALENVMAALFTLPTYETIREDLQRVRARNRLIDRIGRITRDLDQDVAHFKNAEPLSTREWRSLGLGKLIERYGVAYGGYHRLKVAAATDDLAALATSAIGCDPTSDDYLAIRYLIGEWRLMTYAPDPIPGQGPALTENEFLLQFGLGYRFRRLGFVRAKIDTLSCLDTAARKMAKAAAITLPEASDEEAFSKELQRIKKAFGRMFEDLSEARDQLRNPDRSPLKDLITGIGIPMAKVPQILKPWNDEQRRQAARDLLEPRRATLTAAVTKASERLRAPLDAAAEAAEKALKTKDEVLAAGVKLARDAIRKYYTQFENFDFVTFPLRYSTEVGELDKVSIVRISPNDIQHPPTALAGSQYAHFGAFLKRDWRENDVLLGRLHGAERLISALLPEDDQKAERDAFIDCAHRAILQAFVGRRDDTAVTDRVVRGIAEAAAHARSAKKGLRARARNTIIDLARRVVVLTAGQDDAQVTDRVVRGIDEAAARAKSEKKGLRERADPKAFDALLRRSLSPDQLLQYYRTDYAFDSSLPADASARVLARATRVVGKMLEGLGREYHKTTQPGAWIARLAGAFWQLVEIAVPGSLRRIVFKHSMALLALTGGLVAVATLLLRAVSSFYSPKLLAAGLLLFLLPTTLTIAVWALGDSLYRDGKSLRVAGLVGGTVVGLVVLALAGMEVRHLVTGK